MNTGSDGHAFAAANERRCVLSFQIVSRIAESPRNTKRYSIGPVVTGCPSPPKRFTIVVTGRPLSYEISYQVRSTVAPPRPTISPVSLLPARDHDSTATVSLPRR